MWILSASRRALLARGMGTRRKNAVHEIQILQLYGPGRVRRQPGTLLCRQAAAIVRVLPGPDDVERGHVLLLSELLLLGDTSPPWRGSPASLPTPGIGLNLFVGQSPAF